MKRKLFIGSSSEGRVIAEKLKTEIETSCGDWIEPILWTDNVFCLNKSTLHNLVDFSRKYEYGVFVATLDDVVEKRGITAPAMRDNVLFETGMFLGSLGLTRSFILVEKKCSLPTDFLGTTIATYEHHNILEGIQVIISELNNTKESFRFSMVPSTALAIGYFESYIKLIADIQLTNRALPYKFKIFITDNLSDINNEIRQFFQKSNSTQKNIGPEGGRPTVNQLPNGDFWDIPTTLTTLHSVIIKLAASPEVGLNKEYKEWAAHELRNFKGTLEFLISENCLCKKKFEVCYLDD